MPRLLKIFLYFGVFLISFLFFVYWMLPEEAFKTRIILATEGWLGPEYQVQIEDLDTSRLTGVRLENINIQHLQAGKPELVFKAKGLVARVGLFSLLLGSPQFSLDLRMEEGRLTAHLKRREEGWLLEGVLKGVDLKQIPYLQSAVGLQLTSSIGGEISVFYNPKQPLRTEGKMALDIDKLILQESTVPLGEMGTFPLPALNLAASPSAIVAEIGRGSIRTDQLQFKGKDFQLNLKGRIFMASELSRYRINLQGDFGFSEKLWGVFDPLLPESFANELKKQKGKEDLLPLTISGQLAAPQIYSGALRLYPFKPF